jgi:hypothetical protein
MQVAVAVAGTIIRVLAVQEDQEVEELAEHIQEIMGNQEQQIEVVAQEQDLSVEAKALTEDQVLLS